MYSDKLTVEGIDPKTLPLSCLEQLRFSKLLDCLPVDDRVNQIVINKMTSPSFDIDQLRHLHRLDLKAKHPNFLKAYNNCILNSYEKINFKTYYNRDNYIKHDLLDESNLLKETDRYLQQLSSVISPYNLDYSFAINHFPNQIKNKINEVANNGYGGVLERMMTTAPEDQIKLVCPILEKRRPSNKIYLLSSKYTQEEYIVGALKSAPTSLPKIQANVNLNVISKLPTIKRLDVLELLLISREHSFISSMKSVDEVSDLLFPSTMRYPDRVEAVVKKIKHLKGN